MRVISNNLKIARAILWAIVAASIFLPIKLKVNIFAVRVFDILFFLGIILEFIRLTLIGKLKLIIDDLIIHYSIFIICVFISSLFLSSYFIATKNFIQNIQFLFFIFIIISIVKDSLQRNYFFKTLKFCLGFLVVYTFSWHIYHDEYIRYKELDDLKGVFAYLAILLLPNYLIKNRRSFLAMLFLIISIILLILSIERTGWLSFVIVSLIMFYKYNNIQVVTSNYKINFNWFKVISLVVVVIIVSIFVINYFPFIGERFESLLNAVTLLFADNETLLKEGMNEKRAINIRYGLKVFWDHPLLGVGGEQFKEYIDKKVPFSFDTGHHNHFLKYLVENGVFIFVLYVGLYIRMWMKSKKLKKYLEVIDNKKKYIYGYLVGSSLIGYGVVINFLKGGGANNIFHLVLPIGIIVGLLKDAKKTII